MFDGTNNTLITSIPVGSGPIKVAVNSGTHQVYVVNNGDNTVSVIDGNTNIVIATVPTDQSPLVAAVNPVTNRVYVGNNGSTDVTIIDGATDTFVENVQVGFLAPYVGTDGGHTVVVIQDIQPTQLTALNPAKVWIGLKNSDDVGIKFDLLAQVYKDGVLVSSGQLNSVSGGSSGFNNAHLQTIPFTAFAPVDFPQGSQLSMKLSVRNACTGPTHNSGTARLWFNDAAANSLFDATIGTNTNDYFLRDNFVLTTTVGTGPKKTIDVAAGAPCSSFKVFGTWTITH